MIKIFIKKIVKIFGKLKKLPYFCRWRDGRVVDCGGLENRCAARHRGFESLSLRQNRKEYVTPAYCAGVFLHKGHPQIYLQGCPFMLKSPYQGHILFF